MRRDKERESSGAKCRLSKRAKRWSEEKSRKSGAAVGAFIAYGSAKHLWNNGAAKYIVGRRKTKVFSTRENPQDRVLLLAAGVPVVHMHVRYTHTLKSKIDTFSVSIRALAIAAESVESVETERIKMLLRNTYVLQVSEWIFQALSSH